MKLFLVVLLIAVHTVSTNDAIVRKGERFTPNSIMRHLFEMLRNVIRKGDSDKNIQPTDPYKFPYAEFYFRETFLRLQANISHGIINGLGDFEVLKSDFIKEAVAVDLDITFPFLNFEAEHYEMEGSLFHDAFPLSGMGLLQFTIHNLNFCSKVYLKQSEDEKAILIDRFENPYFSIEQITSRTQFDDNFDDIFNAMIEDLLADYLTRFSGYLASSYGSYLIGILNKYFMHFESWRIITVIL
ncbi:uncharacterized protein LOC113233368 [Hyposmocoma kahamanoa]|uniref:uncharacterized protein LOC113233368 n=1 Tax=Hyposmocoma kahamanoa TaxID=1477025 RepID=UPI000E6D9D3D|nr:uncharacterized protein LOC113233368 [Hyposmocoma kahamanoa]